MSKDLVFGNFLGNITMIFFIFCLMIEANTNTEPHLTQVLGFEKNDLGISRGVSDKRFSLGHFLGNATINFFLFFLHDDRAQHCATSGQRIGF